MEKPLVTNKGTCGTSDLTARLGGWFRRTVLWATGRDLLEPPLPQLPLGAYWTISGPPEPRWEMTLSGDAYLRFSLPAGPNVLHRLMQRVVIGIRWRMLKTPNVQGNRPPRTDVTARIPLERRVRWRMDWPTAVVLLGFMALLGWLYWLATKT